MYFEELNSLNNVHFHWILDGEQDLANKKDLIELEYKLRPRIIRFIMDLPGIECCEDFHCLHFDVDMVMREVRISDKTPEDCARLLYSINKITL